MPIFVFMFMLIFIRELVYIYVYILFIYSLVCIFICMFILILTCMVLAAEVRIHKSVVHACVYFDACTCMFIGIHITHMYIHVHMVVSQDRMRHIWKFFLTMAHRPRGSHPQAVGRVGERPARDDGHHRHVLRPIAQPKNTEFPQHGVIQHSTASHNIT